MFFCRFFDICKSFVIFSIKSCPIFVIFSIKFVLVFVIYSKRWLFAILCHKGENTEKSAVLRLFLFTLSLEGRAGEGFVNVLLSMSRPSRDHYGRLCTVLFAAVHSSPLFRRASFVLPFVSAKFGGYATLGDR